MSMKNRVSGHTSSGFGVSDKASDHKEEGDVVGLGLKLNRTESFSHNNNTMMTINRDRPFSSNGGDGPTANEACCRSVNDIYDVAGNSCGGAVSVRTLQPFDISSPTALKSPGGMAAASLGFFPFTNAQWKELERQAMIYKYMMASVPVPPDLLLPITRNLSDPISHSSLGSGAVFNLKYSNNTDPEPGRCRRTDGKKWRCSRDVAPDQKYCERHMHRGRPRSRKPVEVHADFKNTSKKKTRLHNVLPATPTVSSTPYLGSSTSQPYDQTPVFLCKSDVKVSPFESVVSVSSYKEEPRNLEWMMKQDPIPMATYDQQWHHLMQPKIGLTTETSFCNTYPSVFQQHCKEEPLNLNSYAHFGTGDDQQNDECALFFNPDMVSLEKSHAETPRGFIDAWGIAVREDNNVESSNENSVSSNGKLSLSSLALSMASHNTINDEMGQIQMGLGIIQSEQNHGSGGEIKPQISTWSTPSSWVAPTPGGPLAEVLRPSTVAGGGGSAASNPGSPMAGNGDSGSPQGTTVSSPSGVLQKTLASMSDSSASSSPTLVGSTMKPEIVFQWLNHRAN